MTDQSKKPPRAKGSGSIFARTRNGRTTYVGQVDTGTYTAGGSRRYLTVSAKTEAEAKRKLRAKQNEIAKKGLPSQQATTVKSWTAEWLPTYERDVRPSSYGTAVTAVSKYIVPTIGRRRLDRLSPADVRAVQAACPGQPTALRVRGVLEVLLRAAELEGHQVPANVHLVKRPQVAESDRDAIPVEDAHRLLQVISQRPDRARWVAALLQGLRQAECLGLTWECVDLDGGTVDVSWQLQRLPYLDRAAGTFRVPDGYTHRQLQHAFHLVRPKSARGKRVVPLTPWMTAALTEWRDAAPSNPWGLVWTEDGRPHRAQTDRAEWYALQEQAEIEHPAGRPYTLHEARHTAVTLLMEQGIDEGTITRMIGHSSILTTRGYQHVSQAHARRAMEQVAERLRLDSTPPPLPPPRA